MKTFEKGVTIEDLNEGDGPEAKDGDSLEIHFESHSSSTGALLQSHFDEPFGFTLGRGEVIQGWDIGIVGMRSGSTRLITCPPEAAYGSEGIPFLIGPNETVSFRIHLLKIK